MPDLLKAGVRRSVCRTLHELRVQVQAEPATGMPLGGPGSDTLRGRLLSWASDVDGGKLQPAAVLTHLGNVAPRFAGNRTVVDALTTATARIRSALNP
jgi:hypothetical protein